MKPKYFILILMIGLLSACGTGSTNTPASQPTEASIAPTQAATHTSAPIDTAVPTDTPVPPTEAPATQAENQGVSVSFANDILPIFNSRCANCHGGNRTEEGLVLLSYLDIMKGSDNGIVIVTGNANDSLLVKQVASQEMPKRGPKLTPSQVQLIIDWVNQGALDN